MAVIDGNLVLAYSRHGDYEGTTWTSYVPPGVRPEFGDGYAIILLDNTVERDDIRVLKSYMCEVTEPKIIMGRHEPPQIVKRVEPFMRSR